MEAIDLKDVRLGIISERERQGLNQRELASKAGIDQGHLSRIEDVEDEPMRDLAARIVFQIIRRGLNLSLTAFFAQLEGAALSSQGRPAEDDPDDVPAFESEERIAQNVLRLLTNLAIEGVGRREGERVEDHRLPANPRALAAERRPHDRKDRRRDVPKTKKRRPLKK